MNAVKDDNNNDNDNDNDILERKVLKKNWTGVQESLLESWIDNAPAVYKNLKLYYPQDLWDKNLKNLSQKWKGKQTKCVRIIPFFFFLA